MLLALRYPLQAEPRTAVEMHLFVLTGSIWMFVAVLALSETLNGIVFGFLVVVLTGAVLSLRRLALLFIRIAEKYAENKLRDLAERHGVDLEDDSPL